MPKLDKVHLSLCKEVCLDMKANRILANFRLVYKSTEV